MKGKIVIPDEQKRKVALTLIHDYSPKKKHKRDVLKMIQMKYIVAYKTSTLYKDIGALPADLFVTPPAVMKLELARACKIEIPLDHLAAYVLEGHKAISQMLTLASMLAGDAKAVDHFASVPKVPDDDPPIPAKPDGKSSVASQDEDSKLDSPPVDDQGVFGWGDMNLEFGV